MTDPLYRALLHIQGFAASLEAHHFDTLKMMRDMVNGHPRAQDFEPKGAGLSDSTGENGIRPDPAALALRKYREHIDRAYAELSDADELRRRFMRAERPKLDADLNDELCVIHREADHFAVRAHLDLCDACYRFKVSRGRYPTVADVEHYETYGHRWPKERVDPKNPYQKRYVATKQALVDGVQRIEAEG